MCVCARACVCGVSLEPVLVASQSKAWVCSCLMTGIVGLNPTKDTDICLLCLVCVVQVVASVVS
jgi:hypothetical protein